MGEVPAGLTFDVAPPRVDEDALRSATVTYVVQVNGKMRGKIEVVADADKAAIEDAARSNANVQKFTADKTVRKIIIVPNKLVNIVAN